MYRSLLAALMLSMLPFVGQAAPLEGVLVYGCVTPITSPCGSATNPLYVSPVSGGTAQDVNIVKYGGTATTLGQKAMSASIPVVVSSDQSAIATNPTPASSSATGLSTGASSALAANLVVKGSAGNLYSFNVSADSTLSGAAWWIMIYNATSAPADGAVTPAKCYAMPMGTTSFSAAFPYPVQFATGIVIGVSTNGCYTKVASTHAFISGDYK